MNSKRCNVQPSGLHVVHQDFLKVRLIKLLFYEHSDNELRCECDV